MNSLSRELSALTTQRVLLMEPKEDKTLPLAVYMNGWPRCVQLPHGYDGRTSVRWHNGEVFVAHPDLPALRVSLANGCRLVDAEHIQAKDGRMRLVTR